jgi:hypothetical protein
MRRRRGRDTGPRAADRRRRRTRPRPCSGRTIGVRKTLVTSRTTKVHNASSPSMKDQWSGNAFAGVEPAGPFVNPRRQCIR